MSFLDNNDGFGISSTAKTILLAAIVTVALAAIAGLGSAAVVSDLGNESGTFDNSSNLTVSVDWNSSATTSSTANVTIHEEGAYAIDGDDVTSSALNSTTLNGTIAEFDSANVTSGTTYTLDLDASTAGTVDVPASDIADDGTVDLSTYGTITSDDTILSATAAANTIVSDSITADPGNTTDTEYSESDGLIDGTDYRVLVSADDTEADDVTIDFGASGLGFITADSAGGGLLGLAVLLGGAWYVRKED